MCVLFYSSFVCISAYANVYFKSILRECLQARLTLGFPSTAPPPVCVSAALGMLPVWILHQTKQKNAPWFWKHFQNATSFQNQWTFVSNVGVIQVFSQQKFNSVELEKPKEFSKIPRFLEGFKWGLYNSWFFFEKNRSNLVNSIEPRKFQRTKGVSNNFSVVKIAFIIAQKEIM